MDVKGAAGTRVHFNIIATTTPKLLWDNLTNVYHKSVA